MINFDNTILKDVASCKAMALVKHVFGLRGKAEKLAADIGNCYHDALEPHFKGEGKRKVVEVFAESYDRLISPGEAPTEERFHRENCIKILEKYIDERAIDKFPFVPMSFEEVKGCALDEEGEFIFWVKRDIVGKDKVTGQLVPVEHKTTGKLSDYWAKKFRLVSQVSGYCWFTGKEFGQEVGRCYINGIQISKLPDSNRRCPTHGVPYHQCGIEHAESQLYRYERSPEMLEKWRQDAILIAKQFEMYKKAFGGDIGLLKYAPRDGAFVEHCIFCEVKEWCVRGFDTSLIDEFTVYDPWRPWLNEKAMRIDT